MQKKIFSKSGSTVWKSPELAVRLVLLACVVLGLLIATHYGESWDEGQRYDYAERSLAAYLGKQSDLADEKGPFFIMLALLGSKGLSAVMPGWKTIDGWHFMTFISFLLGVYYFYRLCRRLVDTGPAFAATLLFGSQPIIWGHAFINPKDMPFMAFFTAAVSLGLEMVDWFRARAAVEAGQRGIKAWFTGAFQRIKTDWNTAGKKYRILWIGLLILLVILLVSFKPLQSMVGTEIRQAYTEGSASWVGAIFNRIAHNQGNVSVESYVSKAKTLSAWALMALGAGLAFFWMVVGRKVIPSILDQVFLAGCFLGFCADIRTLGPAAGLLVGVYFFFKSGWKSIPPLVKYVASGAVVSYLFWPYLWGDPLGHYIKSLTKAADFNWVGNIMFQGHTYLKSNLPASFLPTMFTLQFTEPALLLIGAGFIIALIILVKKRDQRMDMLLLFVWFTAPVVAAILLHSTIYNNFRQFLFVVPPLFVLAGLAFQTIWRMAKRNYFIFLPIALLAIAPGIYWNVVLHPYEYIYYNSLAGGVSGAYRSYESDYWCISYKETIEYLNQTAPEGANIVVVGPAQAAETYARSDLNIYAYPPDEDKDGQMDYAVLNTQFLTDVTTYPDDPVIFEVSREGSVLAVVKKLTRDTP